MDTINIEFVSQRKFDQALTVMRQLPDCIQLSYEDKLQLYALYKQSVYGPCPNKTVKGSKTDLEKWDSWMRFRNLTTIDAQEQYFLSVIQILSKYSERPHISDIIESLERGSRISAIQSLQPKTLVRTENMIGECSTEGIWIEDRCKSFAPDNYELLHFSGKFGALSDYSLQEMNYNINSPVEFETSSSEGPEDFSDDGISLSTCTVKPYGKNTLTGPLKKCLHTPPTPSLSQDTPSPPRLTNDTERALETLQTQVAALNERLERLQRDMQHSEDKKYHISSWAQFIWKVVRKSAINMVMSALVTAQIYRNRPIPNFVLFLQLVFPTTSFLKLILNTMKKLIR